MPKGKLTSIEPTQASLQGYINALVGHAISSVFNTKYSPSVVRQTRRVVTGKLDYIDYAVPCFDLGTILKKSPQEVALKLAQHINKKQSNGDVRAEQNGGYLNFRISEEFIQEFVVEAVRLLRKNGDSKYLVKPKGKFYSFMFVSAKHADFAEVGAQALSLIEETRKKTGLDGASVVFTDIATADHAARRVTKTKYIQFTGHVKKTNDLVKEICKKRTNSRYRVVSDSSTPAVYVVIDGENSYALRSANGRLCDAAFLLYALSLVPAYRGPLFEKGVIIAPQVMHDQIRDLGKLLIGGRKTTFKEQPYTYFDPLVSKADLVAIKKRASSVDVIMKEVTATIRHIDQQNLSDQLQRQSCLALVDFYSELRTCIQDQSFPMLFDVLNSAIHNMARFNEVSGERLD